MTSVRKDPRLNMGHALVRSNWIRATTGQDEGERSSHPRFSGRVLQLLGCESLHPFQPLPSPRCRWEVLELPSEGMFDASHQVASVSLASRLYR